MTGPAAHNQKWQISEIIFGIPLLISLALDFFRPLSIAHRSAATILIVIGAILVTLGVGCVYYARRELAAQGQPTDPGRPTTMLVNSGIYAVSRNPLYLGAVLLVLGLGLALNSWWVLLSLIPAVILCHTVLIFPEERYLAGKLGDEYQAYLHSVNRWLGRKRARL